MQVPLRRAGASQSWQGMTRCPRVVSAPEEPTVGDFLWMLTPVARW